MREQKQPTAKARFEPWAWVTDASGAERRIGVEIEFGGLDVKTTADVVVEVFGGRIERVGHHQLRVHGSQIGDLKVELDSRFVKERKHRELLESLGISPENEVSQAIDDLVVRAATTVVPCEIVTGPLTFAELERLEALRERLHLRGAEGTAAEPWYVFGVHFNPALPSTEASVLYAFLQSFCLLEDWIREAGHVNWSRRISPYVDPFPEGYRDEILRPGPAPERRALIETYLRFNPSRNRGLDMLPAFAHLEPDLVKRYVQDALVKPRPTFHYRMADCRVDEPEWRLADEWAPWAAVERLAADDARRGDLIRRGVLAEGPV